MNPVSAWRWWLLLVAFSLLQACGFQLRGSYVVPAWIEKVYLQDASAANEITPQLRQALVRSGTSIAGSVAEANVVLVLGRETVRRRLLATASGSHIKDYELRYEVPIVIHDGKGNVLAGEGLITVFRELVYDETQVLAKSAEQETMQREMVQDAVRQIMRRLQALPQVLEAEE